MKRVIGLLFAAVVFFCAFCAFCALAEAAEKESAPVDWGRTYIEATGMAHAPHNAYGAHARALARRGAIVDLQRNLLKSIGKIQVDSSTTMNNFMAGDKVYRISSEISGLVQGVQVLDGKWDGEAYTVTGRIRTDGLRVLWQRCRVSRR